MFQAPDFPSKAPARVAVLPFDNESTSLKAADILRGLVQERISSYGYAALAPGEVDSKLREVLGVTDGGQLRKVDAKKLGEALGVEGLLYGTVEEFAYQNVGFFQRRVVQLRLRLVAADSGERLWESVGKGEQDQAVLKKQEALGAFVRGLGQQTVESVMGAPLKPESLTAVAKVFDTLPRR